MGNVIKGVDFGARRAIKPRNPNRGQLTADTEITQETLEKMNSETLLQLAVAKGFTAIRLEEQAEAQKKLLAAPEAKIVDEWKLIEAFMMAKSMAVYGNAMAYIWQPENQSPGPRAA